MNIWGSILLLGIGAFVITFAVSIIRELIARIKYIKSDVPESDDSGSADDEVNK